MTAIHTQRHAHASTCIIKSQSIRHAESDYDARIYANRSLSMDRIKYIGFDMDYTLVAYKSPEYEQLAYEFAVERLISIGYPKELANSKYDPTFTVRGLFFDKVYGNLLKCDPYGNILSCFHGFNSCSTQQIRALYPNKYVQPSDHRIEILYTLFHLPETFLLSALVDFFDNRHEYKRIEDGPNKDKGVKCGDVEISYWMIQQDVRRTVDWIHNEGKLKERTLQNLEKYVNRDKRLPKMLYQLRQTGRKVFLATNSGYEYTMRLLTYMLEFPECDEPGLGPLQWKSYFDYLITDANKPLFFTEGSMLREVDEDTHSLKLGVFTGVLQPGQVYSGGSSSAFCKYTGASGKQILYVGDHIFGDVIKAKIEQAWRTFLVVPELTEETHVWESIQALYQRLQNFEYILSVMNKKNNHHVSPSGPPLPDLESIRKAIKEIVLKMEESYPRRLGSLLRCGSQLTYFANQASRYADLYGSSCLCLMNYTPNHLFTARHQLMAHERRGQSLAPPLPELKHFRRSKAPVTRVMSVADWDLDEEDSPMATHAIDKEGSK
ncbi:hypothetical protein EMCRGX_G029649 [Ephydatia muelleri]